MGQTASSAGRPNDVEVVFLDDDIVYGDDERDVPLGREPCEERSRCSPRAENWAGPKAVPNRGHPKRAQRAHLLSPKRGSKVCTLDGLQLALEPEAF